MYDCNSYFSYENQNEYSTKVVMSDTKNKLLSQV